MNGLLSVIVPVYKVENDLDKCINSIVHQEYKNLEIILVDDGSPDRCPVICNQWAKKDQRIKVIHQKNKGVSSARNAGMSIAKGDYIAFVDGDDFLSLSMYNVLINTIQKYAADIAACGRFIYTDGVVGQSYRTKEQMAVSNQEAVKKMLCGDGVDIAVWDKLFRTEIIRGIQFPETKLYEDAFFAFRAVKNARRIAFTGTCEYYYRLRLDSVSQKEFSIPRWENVLAHLMDTEAFINENFSVLREDFRVYMSDIVFNQLICAMKCKKTELEWTSEYKIMMDIFQKNFRYLFLKTERHTIKSKIIAIMIRIHVYQLYLNLKQKYFC